MKTVLVLDDSPYNRLDIKQKRLDINKGVNFLLSANYNKEKEILETKQIDLTIIDLQMSEKNGADPIVDMKSVNITEGIPIIVTTAAGEESLLRTSIELIVDYYLRNL